jgi:hypothetical protein
LYRLTRRFISWLTPEDAKFEEAGLIIGPAVEAGFAETRRREAANPEDARQRGDPELHRWRRRRNEETGQPGES